MQCVDALLIGLLTFPPNLDPRRRSPEERSRHDHQNAGPEQEPEAGEGRTAPPPNADEAPVGCRRQVAGRRRPG